MKFKLFLVIILAAHFTLVACDEVKMSIGTKEGEENSTFVATDEWQEIKAGQRVPKGLHYRINLQTGKKEAKLLAASDEQPTSLTETQQQQQQEEEQTIDEAKKRLEDALKNIPAQTFEAETEQRWKEEVKKKFKSYEEIKADLKDLNLEAKTEAEQLTQLMDEFASDTSSSLDVLRDLEYLLHSIDNALLFISKGGLETIVVRHLVNQTDVAKRVVLLKIVGALTQNNLQVKKYVCEKTNLVGDLVTIVDKSESNEELSAALFGIGSLVRSNKLVTSESLKKLFTVLAGILSQKSLPVGLKTKSLVLIDDLLSDSHVDLVAFVESSNLCELVSNFFENHKNPLIFDMDAAEKTAAALLNLSEQCGAKWSEMPMMRHTLLVVLNNYRIRADEESDDDLKFVYGLVIEHFENVNGVLYGELKISSDDLSERYKDEL